LSLGLGQTQNAKLLYLCAVKKIVVTIILIAAIFFLPAASPAQCSICTKTAQQMGEKPARALNSAIIYLMLTPFAIMGYLGYRWWKNNRD